jgi:hypothetical protein
LQTVATLAGFGGPSSSASDTLSTMDNLMSQHVITVMFRTVRISVWQMAGAFNRRV